MFRVNARIFRLHPIRCVFLKASSFKAFERASKTANQTFEVQPAEWSSELRFVVVYIRLIFDQPISLVKREMRYSYTQCEIDRVWIVLWIAQGITLGIALWVVQYELSLSYLPNYLLLCSSSMPSSRFGWRFAWCTLISAAVLSLELGDHIVKRFVWPGRALSVHWKGQTSTNEIGACLSCLRFFIIPFQGVSQSEISFFVVREKERMKFVVQRA